MRIEMPAINRTSHAERERETVSDDLTAGLFDIQLQR